MKIRKLYLIAAVLLTASCAGYKQYAEDNDISVGDYQALAADYLDTAHNMAQLSWGDYFTDPDLKALIGEALESNIDLRQARLRVAQAEASLQAARLAYLPSLALAPQGSASRFAEASSRGYTLPVTAEWQLDIFGSLTSQKRSAAARAQQAADYQQAAQAELIAAVSDLYYQLVMLDAQKSILIQTDSIWTSEVATIEALMEAGRTNSAGVGQMRASLCEVKMQQLELERSIRIVEQHICLLLSQPYHTVRRGTFDALQMPSQAAVGVPVQLLANRPDVRAAQRQVEAAFYEVGTAKAAFYPNLTLSGLLGWSNSQGGIEVNPAQLLMNAVAQLTQPIFAQGRLRANLKISQAEYESARLAFVQTVLKAGNEVNEALLDCQTASAKRELLIQQRAMLTDVFDATKELMNKGTATYLEVLTSQEKLLNAQLGTVANDAAAAQALVRLYIALGGGGL